MGVRTLETTAWMRLCAYRMSGPLRWHGSAAQQLMAGDIAARLWTQATAADRVQHIRIRPAGTPETELAGHDGLRHHWLDVGILVMATSDDRARAVGARLCAGALAASPDTVGWTLQPLI